MQRRNFLLTSILAIPFASFAKFKDFVRAKKGIFVKADETCFNGLIKNESFDKIFCKVSEKDTDGTSHYFINNLTEQ